MILQAADASTPEIRVALDTASTKTVTVNYAVSGGTALNGIDYKLAPGKVTFAPGETQKTLPLQLISSHPYDGDRTLQITLSAPSNAVIGTSTALYVIPDSVGPPKVSFVSATGTGPQALPGTLQVGLSAKSLLPVKVAYSVTGGTADAGIDYRAFSGFITFQPGVLTQNLSIPVLANKRYQANQTVEVSLSQPTGAALGTQTTAIYTIQNTNPPPTASFKLAAESGPVSKNPLLVVQLSAASDRMITVDYSAAASSSAVAGTNYTLPATQTITFSSGQITQTIPVTLLGDGVAGPNKTLKLQLANPTNAKIGTISAETLTIIDNEPLPSVQFAKPAASGPQTAAGSMTVSLSAKSPVPVTVAYAVTGGTAVVGRDYKPFAGTLTIPAGSLSQVLAIPVLNDRRDNDDQTIELTLSAPGNAILGAQATATYTIINSAPPPTVSFKVATQSGAVTQDANLVVQLSAASNKPIAVDYATAGAFTASPGTDFTLPATQTLTFAPGVTSQSIPVHLIGNGVSGPNKTLTLQLSNPTNASIGAVKNETFTIIDNEPVPSVQFASATGSGAITGPGLLPVKLSAKSTVPVTVAYAVTGGSGVAGQDYKPFGGTITFAPGTTTQNIVIPVLNDFLAGNWKTVELTLSMPGNAILGTQKTSVYTIKNNNLQPTVNFKLAAESGPAAKDANLVVQLSAKSDQEIRVFYRRLSFAGAAVLGTDYLLPTDQTLTFQPGETTKAIPIHFLDNGLGADKSLKLNLSYASDAIIGAVATETYTIRRSTPSVAPNTATPILFLQSPVDVGTVTSNATIAGAADEPYFGLASLTASTDGGAPVIVSTSGKGLFQYSTNLAADGSADGDHTVVLEAVSNIGMKVRRTVTFTLDSQAPTVTLLGPPVDQPILDNFTVVGTATDVSSGVARVGTKLDGVDVEDADFDRTTGEFSFTTAFQTNGLDNGAHTLTFTAFDNAGKASPPRSLSFNFNPPVNPPSLAAIGPLTVAPGGYLAVPLNAADPNGLPIQYSIRRSGPLPPSTLRADGTLVFQPSPADLGTYHFTVIASNGKLKASRDVTLTVAGAQQSTTSLSGKVLDSSGNPIAGVPVSMGTVTGTTNAQGVFTLTFNGPIPSDESLEVHASQAPGATKYVGYSTPISRLSTQSTYDGYENQLAEPVRVMKLDTAAVAQVSAAAGATLLSSALAGAKLVVPAGGIKDQTGAAYVGKVALVSLPPDQIPAAMRGGSNPAASVMLMALDNPGKQLSIVGGELTLPNTGGYSAGSAMKLGTLTRSGVAFASAPSDGFVSQDGKTIKLPNFNSPLLPVPTPGKEPKEPEPEPMYFEPPPYYFFNSPEKQKPKAKKEKDDCDDGEDGPDDTSGGDGYNHGNDELHNDGPGNDVLHNDGPGNDVLHNDGPGNDVLHNDGPGNDVLHNDGPGNDILHNDGPGNDYGSNSVGSPKPGRAPSPMAPPPSQAQNDYSPWSDLIPITTPQAVTGHGSLQQDQPLATYQSQGVMRQLKLHYDSITASPNNILHIEDEINGSAYGTTNPVLATSVTIHDGATNLQLGGSSLGGFNGGAGVQFASLPRYFKDTVAVGINADTSSLSTGIYQYTANVGVANYNPANKVVSGPTDSVEGQIVVVNNQASPFGSGWTLSGWQQIVVVDAKTALLVDGDARRIIFESEDGTHFAGPDDDFTTLIRNPAGTWTRTFLDQTVYRFNADGQIASMTDRAGAATSFGYDGSARLTSITDPSGLSTNFGYAGDTVSTVTGPDGSVTQLQHDADGNLSVILLPDGAQQQYNYDTQHRLTRSITPNQHIVDTLYDQHGRATSISVAGKTVNFQSPDVQDVVPFAKSIDPATAPMIGAPKPLVQTITDGNGNVLKKTFTDDYHTQKIEDALGTIVSYERTQDLVTRKVDGNGNVTLFQYLKGQVSGTVDSASLQSAVSGKITTPGDTFDYTFQGAAGQRLYLAKLGFDAGITADLIAPDGTKVGGIDTAPFTLDGAGQYTVRITGSQAGSFRFTLVNADSAPLVPLNSKAVGSLDPALGPVLYRIDATGIDRLLVHNEEPDSNNYSTRWTLYDQNNQQVASSSFNGDLSANVANGGTFLLVMTVTGTSSIGYGFTTYHPTTTTATLTLGTVTAVDIDSPGDIRNLTFTATANERIYVDAARSAASWTLTSPSGESVYQSSQSGLSTQGVPLTLFAGGVYTLTVTGSQEGSYPFSVSDIASSTAAAIGATLTGTLDAAGHNAWYSLTGNAGQRLNFSTAGSDPIGWTLYGPGNQVIDSNNANSYFPGGSSTDESVALPESGTYFLSIWQVSGGGNHYRLKVTDTTQAVVAVTGLGVDRQGTLAANAKANFTFTAPAGRMIALDVLGQSAYPIYFTITVQRNGSPYQILNSYSDTSPIVLPDSGTYTLVANNSGGVSANYRFRLIDVTGAPSLTLDQTVNGTLAGGYSTTVYRVATSTGQVLNYDALRPTDYQGSGVDLSLAGSNRFISLPVYYNPDAGDDYFLGPQEGGAVYVVLSNQTASSRTYSFRIQDLATAAILPLNTDINATLDPPQRSAVYRFTGSAGQYLHAAFSGAGLTLYAPDGNTLHSDGQNYGNFVSGTLPLDGTYYAVVSGSPGTSTTPIDYTLKLSTPGTNSFSLTDGALTSGTLAEDGQRDRYTFTGTAGQRFVLSGPNSPSFHVDGTLTGPDGKVISVGAYSTLPVLPVTGTYTLTIAGGADDYHFRLSTEATATMLVSDTPASGTFANVGDTQLYRYHGVAGQRIFMSGDRVQRTLYSPTGKAVDELNGEATLPVDGDYYIALQPQSYGVTYPFAYQFEIVNLVSESTALTLGSSYSGTFVHSHDLQTFTFTAVAGQRFFFDDLGNSNSVWVTGWDPAGRYFDLTSGDDSTSPSIATTSGTYRLTLQATQDATNYAFRILDVETAPLLTVGADVFGTLNPASQTAIYRIAGNAGQHLGLQPSTGFAAADKAAEWRLFGFGTQTLDSSFNGLDLDVVFPQDGSYVLEVQGLGGATPINYGFKATDLTAASVATSGLGIVKNGTLTANTSTTFTFTASAGLPVLLDNQDPSTAPASYELRAPSGKTVFFAGFRQDGQVAVLPESGTYKVIVSAGGAGATYAFRMLDLSAAPSLPLNSVVNGSLTAGQTTVYRFTGSPGEVLFNNPLVKQLTGVTVTEYRPDGSGQSSNGDFALVHSLETGGIYYLGVSAASAASYRFEFDDVSAMPTLSTGALLTDTAQANYRISGAAGQKFYFANQLADSIYNFTLNLLDANGQRQYAASSVGNGFLLTLPTTGSFILQPFSLSGSSHYSFQFQQPSHITASVVPQAGTPGAHYGYDDQFNQLKEAIDPLGNRTLFEIDPLNGNVLTVTNVNTSGGPNTVTHYAYTATGQVSTITDGLGFLTDYDYDGFGRMIQVTHAVGTPQQAIEQWAYDAAGNITSTTDANGKSNHYGYDAVYRLTRITDPLGNVTQYAYDAAGNLTSITNPLGRITRFVYDDLNSRAQAIAADGGVTTSAYDDADNLTSVTDALGHTTRYFYDSRNRVTKTIDAAGGVSLAGYDKNNNQTSSTDPLGRTTLFRYDSGDRLTSVTDPLGRETRFAYDADGNLLSMTDPLGHARTAEYDSLNRVTRDADALGNARTYSYDVLSQVTAISDARGNTRSYSYDPRNRATAFADALGNVSHRQFDAAGRVTASDDALGNATSYGYDDDGRLTSITDALGRISAFGYDAAGNITSYTDELGRTTRYAFDIMNRKTATTDTLGRTAVLAYDRMDNVTSSIDELGRTTRYAYDTLDRRTQTTNALGNSTRLAYDAAGNVTSGTDLLGRITRYAYDANDELTAVTDAVGNVRRQAYDAAGNVTSSTDELARVTQYVYDAIDRLTAVVNPLGQMTISKYDAVGNITSSTDALGRVSRFEYDAENRLTKTIDPASHASITAYDSVGKVTATTDALSHTTFFAYDPLYRLTKIVDALGGTSSYGYDAVGNLVVSTDPLGNTTHYAYNARDWLTLTTDALGGAVSDAYDAVGNVTAETDELGSTVQFSYDALDRMTQAVDALGGTVTRAFDAMGNLTASTDRLGRTTRFAYDSLDRLTKTTDALGGTVTDGYDAVGNLTAETDPLGRITRYVYDALDRATQTTDALGGVTTSAFDAVGNLTAATDALGRITQIAYDVLDQATLVTDALGGQTSFAFDAVGNLTSNVDALGHATLYRYDALDRQTATVDPLGRTSLRAYDAADNVTSATDALGRATTFSYDALLRLTKTTDALGGETAFAYDAAGDVLSRTDPLGHATQFAYDALHRQTSVTDPLGHATIDAYDAVGNLTAETDPLGKTTRFAYDVLNRTTQSIDANGQATLFGYDAASNRTSVTDPVGNATVYAFDALDRVTSATTPLGTSTYRYDAVGNLTSATDRLGRTTRHVFDQLDRETSEIWVGAGGSTVYTATYSYDAIGQMTAAIDANSSYQFAYDATGELTQRSNAGTAGVPAVTMNYAYDDVGNLLSRSDTIGGAAAGTTTYAYDALDRMTQVEQSGSGVTAKRVDFGYDAASRMTSVTRYADLAGTQQVAVSQYAFNADDSLASLSHTHGATTIAGYAWTYDDVGRLTSATSPDGADAYSYDSAGQLTSATHSAGQSNEAYSYDANGNRTNSGYSTGADNLVLSDGAKAYAYDAEGNRTSATDIATGEVTLYSYDHRNRLTNVVVKAAGGSVERTVAYVYDVFNNRIGETVTEAATSAVVTQRFVVDGSQIALTFDGNGALADRYLYGPAVDQVLAGEDAQGHLLWSLTDQLGSVRDLIDSSGNLQNHLVYDSFGKPVSQSNAAVDFLFSYTGQEYDEATGLYYYNARYYDPSLGRFLTQDPLGFAAGDANLYRYVGNSPINFSDPSGLQGESGSRQPTKFDLHVEENHEIPAPANSEELDAFFKEYANLPDVSGAQNQAEQAKAETAAKADKSSGESNPQPAPERKFDPNKNFNPDDVQQHKGPRTAEQERQRQEAKKQKNREKKEKKEKEKEDGPSCPAGSAPPIATGSPAIPRKHPTGTGSGKPGKPRGPLTHKQIDDLKRRYKEEETRERIKIIDDAMEKTKKDIEENPFVKWTIIKPAEAVETANAAHQIKKLAVKAIPVILKNGKGLLKAAATFFKNDKKDSGDLLGHIREVYHKQKNLPKNQASKAIDYARYKDQLRAQMSKPHVKDPYLNEQMSKLYRDNAKVGSGSTADAFRHTRDTGELVGGSDHAQKTHEMIETLQKWIKANPTASASDRAAAENVIIDMKRALKGS